MDKPIRAFLPYLKDLAAAHTPVRVASIAWVCPVMSDDALVQPLAKFSAARVVSKSLRQVVQTMFNFSSVLIVVAS